MEKREPSLVPEWRRKGNGSGVGNKNNIQSSSARLDSSLSHTSKSTNPRTKTDVDSVGSPFLDRSFSTKNAYRNFNVKRRGGGKDRRMETRKQDDHLAQGFIKNGRRIYNKSRMLPGISHATSSRDFPRLKTVERKEGVPDVLRISSPGLSLAVQRLSVGDSGLTAGEGRTPAPAEVPNVIEKSGSDSVGTTITLTGQTRNMAEALFQAPRTGTLPQESSKIQGLEDRALKLIPLVSSAPKRSVSKTKPMVRSGLTGFASFGNTHQHSSMLLGNLHSNYGRQIKTDSTKKLVILKPAVKGSGGPSRITNSLAAGFQMIAAPSAPFITSVAQTQSRNAFYSALKKKTSTDISTSSCTFSSVEEKDDVSKELVASDPSSVQAVERVEKVSDAAERVSVFESTDIPDEEEAEFLRSLGWDENNTEVEALTEEEIKAFYEQHKEVKPSLMKKLPIFTEATEDVTPSS